MFVLCFELGSPHSLRSDLNSYFHPQGKVHREPRFLLMLREHRTGGHSLLLFPLPKASKATGFCAHMASSSLCKTAFIFASPPGSGSGKQNHILLYMGLGWIMAAGTGGRDTPLFMSSALSSGWGYTVDLCKDGSGQAGQGDLSSEPGLIFPSACAPPLVELMSRGRVSVPGEAQVGGCVLNTAIPPGNVFWSIAEHKERCVLGNPGLCPAHPNSGSWELSIQGHHQTKTFTVCYPKGHGQKFFSRPFV